MRLCIGICTYRRNEGLARALDAVARLRRPDGVEPFVVVADNNPDGSARPVTERPFPLPLVYAHETGRGISFARNRVLAEAGDADALAFVDDDQSPDPGWLSGLVAMHRRLGAEVVTGPTLPVFEHEPPAWLVAGRFLEPRRWPDGAAVDTAFTGNVLIRLDAVRRLGLRFDEALALIGGEDIQFFDRLRRAGAALRWADGAIMREIVPPARTNLRWLLARWYRTGCSDAILHRDRHPGLGGRATAAGKGAARVALGAAALAAVALTAGLGAPHQVVARLYTPIRGLGMIASAFGRHYREYG